MQVEWEGRTWGFDASEMTLAQAFVIKDYTKDVLYPAGRSLAAWQKGLNEADPGCVAAAYWLMLQQNGVSRPIAETEIPVIRFNNALQEATVAEARAEAERKRAQEKAAREAEEAAAVPTPAPSPAPGSPPDMTLPPLPGSAPAG